METFVSVARSSKESAQLAEGTARGLSEGLKHERSSSWQVLYNKLFIASDALEHV